MLGLLVASGDSPLNHVVQHGVWSVGEGGFRGFTFLSNHIIMQIIAALIVCLIIPRALKKRAGTDEIGRLVPTGFGNAIEGICSLLRKHLAEPALGRYTDRFVPYIWSVFFFILTCNLLGLIPLATWTKPLTGHALGGTSTGNVWITGTLAATTLAMIVGNGLRLHGMNYVKHFFMGPFPISILIAVLEMIGLVAKSFALCMRLFANMVAGHVLLAVLLGFIGVAATALGTGVALVISIPVVLGSVAINFLELFVAFIQAFIFTFLTTMFIGQAVNIHHDHKHEHDEAPSQAAVVGAG
jgi:F-type H+-transporting ATPase subunit a